MKIPLILGLLTVGVLNASTPTVPYKKPEQKPMKVFVEINGKMYEVVIEKHRHTVINRADQDTERKFKEESKKYGIAYLQDRIVLVDMSPNKIAEKK
jgi:hypothetical protein